MVNVPTAVWIDDEAHRSPNEVASSHDRFKSFTTWSPANYIDAIRLAGAPEKSVSRSAPVTEL